MRKKFLILSIMTCFVIIGAGCSKGQVRKVAKVVGGANTDELLQKYCDIYVNKFQKRDLESYGIEINEEMGEGYYKSVEDCVSSMKKIEDDAEKTCKQYGKSSGTDCDEARQSRQKNYKKNMTRAGCRENGENNRCFMFNTKEPRWQGVDAEQIADADRQFKECLEKVDYSCAELPEKWE